MKTFKTYISEAWTNRIGKTSRESSVVSTQKYNDPQHFKKDAKKMGKVGDLHLYSSNNGSSFFTWHPKDKTIHHVVRAAMSNGDELKYLSSHKRETSPVPMHKVYSSLVRDHGKTLIGVSHSPGAQHTWKNLGYEKGVEIHGRHPDGTTVKLRKNARKYADKDDKSPENKKLGKMELIAKRSS